MCGTYNNIQHDELPRNLVTVFKKIVIKVSGDAEDDNNSKQLHQT